jgi:hypothetical protein
MGREDTNAWEQETNELVQLELIIWEVQKLSRNGRITDDERRNGGEGEEIN